MSTPPYCLPPITKSFESIYIEQWAYLGFIISDNNVNALSGSDKSLIILTWINFLLISPSKICKSIVAF